MVLAARALAKDATNVALDVAGEQRQGALNRRFLPSQLQQPLRIANTGEGPLQAVVTVNGAPLVAEPAADRGFKIERLYFTLDGKPADPSKARQNDRFAVVLRITEPQPQFGRVIVADYLPAGFEIDNPRLVSSGETGTLPWIQDGADAGELRSSAMTASAPRSTARATIRRCSPWPMSCARCRRGPTCIRRRSSRTCTAPTASAAPPPAPSR